MKMSIAIEGELREDKYELDIFLNSYQLWDNNCNARHLIKQRLRDLENDDIKEDENEFLETLTQELFYNIKE